MQAYRFEFSAEVTDEQRLLNGSRSLALEGEASDGGDLWTLLLSFVQPKEPGAAIDEGDLTIAGPDGEFFAGVAEGRSEPELDDLSGAEREVLDLHLRIEGGEGAFDGARGVVHLYGRLSGGQAELWADVEIEALAKGGTCMDVLEAIHTRRTTKLYLPEAPARELVEQVLEAAVWAPNHRLTEPWGFYVLRGESLREAADLRARATEDSVEGATEAVRRAKGDEARRKALAAPVCIVVTVRQSEDPIVRDEDYAATAAAIQNMLLTARGFGLAAFWGTGILTGYAPFRELLGLAREQRIVGLVQLGYSAQERSQRRAPAASKTRWLD